MRQSLHLEPTLLRRALGVPLLVGYGLGVIIGAGIYVLAGTVIDAAGAFAPLAFLLAGLLAGLIAVCYGELAGRFPEAAGAAAYVKEAFGSNFFSGVTGLAVAAVVLTSTAAVARGSASYAQFFLTAPAPLIAAAVALVSTLVACLGVRESVGVAAVMSAVEIGGLLLVVAAGWADLPSWPAMTAALPSAAASIDPRGVATGTFLAFFAYIGFENMANMAEETHETERAMPRAMLISLAISMVLYLLVIAVALAAGPAATNPELHHAPLLAVGARASWYSPALFAAIALVAVSNGVLIEILMLSRLFYGMSRRGWLPAWLGEVHPRSVTPVRATVVAGAGVLLLSAALDVAFLASVASAITLLVFAAVAAALWRLQRRHPRRAGFAAPRWLPPAATFLCLGLALVQLVAGY